MLGDAGRGTMSSGFTIQRQEGVPGAEYEPTEVKVFQQPNLEYDNYGERRVREMF
jgi:hypothetical protein